MVHWLGKLSVGGGEPERKGKFRPLGSLLVGRDVLVRGTF